MVVMVGASDGFAGRLAMCLCNSPTLPGLREGWGTRLDSKSMAVARFADDASRGHGSSCERRPYRMVCGMVDLNRGAASSAPTDPISGMSGARMVVMVMAGDEFAEKLAKCLCNSPTLPGLREAWGTRLV